jgi:hypothetical protein
MMHPELRYDLARQDHQGRIDAAARSREARAARHEQRGTSWLAAIGTRLRPARRAGTQAASTGVAAVASTVRASGPVGRALAV